MPPSRWWNPSFKLLLLLCASGCLAAQPSPHPARQLRQSLSLSLLKPDFPGKAPADAAQPHLGNASHANGVNVAAGQTVTAPVGALETAALLVVGVVVFIYSPRGPGVVFSVLAYLAALATMKLTVKWVFVEYHFKFPCFVTVAHFVAGALACFFLLLLKRFQSGKSIPVPTFHEFFFMIAPISLAVAISIGANNMALSNASVAFTEVIGSTTCLITVGMVMLMGMPFDRALLLPTGIVAAGCIISTVGEINFSALGMMLCFVANAFRSTKVALQQKLMTGERKDKFDPCTLLFWISVPSAIVMLAASFASEGLEPYHRLRSMDLAALRGLTVAIGASCVNAVVLNLAQLFVTKDLGAVGGQLVAQAKVILTVLSGMILFGEAVSYLEMSGFVMVAAGVYMFSTTEQQLKKKQLDEEANKERA